LIVVGLIQFVYMSSAQSSGKTYLDYLKVDLTKGGVQADLSDYAPYKEMRIGGIGVSVENLPKGLKNTDLGIVLPTWIDVKVIHRWPLPDTNERWAKSFLGSYSKPIPFTDAPIMVKSPKAGDYLLFMVAGKNHYGGHSPNVKLNDVFMYRSKDKGTTWSDPILVTPNTSYNHHAWVPLVPKGSNRIYMFSTEPKEGDYPEGEENAGIGMRYSDDDGYTWSAVQRINPVNDPSFQGMWCIRATETVKGTWLIAPHESYWQRKPLETRLYLFRSADKGKSWEVLPDKRPNGWYWHGTKRMEEGRPIAFDDGSVVLFARTDSGSLFRSYSTDDGQSWSTFKGLPLVHPDAPPMLTKLSDDKTLVLLFHNRYAGKGHATIHERTELWSSLSFDKGITWTEPRFLAVTSTTSRIRATLQYADISQDGDIINIFIPHNLRQILHMQMKVDDLWRLPTMKELFPGEKR
jgi:hypothetical protein